MDNFCHIHSFFNHFEFVQSGMLDATSRWLIPLTYSIAYPCIGGFFYLACRLMCYCITNSLHYFGSSITGQNIRLGFFHFFILHLIPDMLLLAAITFSFKTWIPFSRFVTSMLILAPVWLFKLWLYLLFLRFVKESSQLSYGKTCLSVLPIFSLYFSIIVGLLL